ncbi:MAG: DNA repair protein RadA [Firmicutes bacterium]|nr:DNA repair protein RadA [Bacillota bacterium]
MAKAKIAFVCDECGWESGRWLGKCPGCGAWNTLKEHVTEPATPLAGPKPAKRQGGTGAPLRKLAEIDDDADARKSCGISELDRVLGGGIVEGSVTLVGGDPGVGKSTLLLQTCGLLADAGSRVLYVTGEESARQIKLRARRLGVRAESLWILAENAMDNIEAQFQAAQPDFMVVDSIQTVYRPELSAAPGSVSQVRECASLFIRLAKTSGCAIFLVGHVTKEGAIAGPRVLEHMVDAVLYFEGDRQHAWRILRAVKNRFGSVNELGLFEMREQGMTAVENPSELLLSERARGASGSIVACGMEGTRPMLVDLQALVSRTPFGMPRRTADGLDTSRVALLLAVLEKRVGLRLFDQDVYINVAGGMTLTEPSADLPLCLAIASSLRDRLLPQEAVVFGEVGLAGEVRAVSLVERRLMECARLGFTICVLPKKNLRGLKAPDGIELRGVDTVGQAVRTLLG